MRTMDRPSLLERAESHLAVPSTDALNLARDMADDSGIPFPLLDALAALWHEYMPARKHERELWLRVGALRTATRESVRLIRERLPFRDPFSMAAHEAGEARPEVARSLRAAGERLQGALAAVGGLLGAADVAPEERALGVDCVRALFDGDALRDRALLPTEPGLEEALRALESALSADDVEAARGALRAAEERAGAR